MTFATGLDHLLDDPSVLARRRYGLLSQQAAVAASMRPAHLALAGARHVPVRLFSPEHGYYGVEQYMVTATADRDPLTGVEIVSLYGDDEASLSPSPGAFEGLDLLVVDLQDIGSRYYTYAATSVWAAQAAREAGCEVWVLDRPNPLGGAVVSGNLRGEGYEAFISAFRHPVRHGLTMAEIVLLELGLTSEEAESDGILVWPLRGWSRDQAWPAVGRPWIAPSPNMPSYHAAVLFPGMCLLEATTCSEGRGTTRPFQLMGHPALDPMMLIEQLGGTATAGLALIPTWFRPQFEKHAGEVCGGVEIVVTDPSQVAAYRFGLELLLALRVCLGDDFAWRTEPYEFVADRPAIDLLTGGSVARDAIDSADQNLLCDWCSSFATDEAEFEQLRRPYLLYS